MQIQTTINCDVRVSATFEAGSGSLTVKVLGSSPYAEGRTTTVEVSNAEISLHNRERLQAVLSDIAEEAEDKLGPRVMQAVYKSAEIAASLGEL